MQHISPGSSSGKSGTSAPRSARQVPEDPSVKIVRRHPESRRQYKSCRIRRKASGLAQVISGRMYSQLVLCLAIAATANALPQGGQSSSSTATRTNPSSSSRSANGLVGTFSSVAPTSTAGLPPNFTIPDGDNSQPQNTSNIPKTPIGPRIPDIPDYALTYAPIVYLAEDEQFWPSRQDVHLGKHGTRFVEELS